jgi:hypothetical protein
MNGAHRLQRRAQNGERPPGARRIRGDPHRPGAMGGAAQVFLGRGRHGPVATPARNVRLNGCIYKSFSQFREGLRPNLLKVARVKLSHNQVAGGKYDKEANLGLSPTLDATR